MADVLGNKGDAAFNSILLRSSTPPPSEKVASYIHRMIKDPPQSPQSNIGDDFEHLADSYDDWAKAAASRLGPAMRRSPDGSMTRLEDEVFGDGNGSVMSYPDADPVHAGLVDEVDSLIQENTRSHMGASPRPDMRSLPNQTPRTQPRVLSMSTGPSWGNFNDFPREQKPNYGDTPNVAAHIPLPTAGPPTNYARSPPPDPSMMVPTLHIQPPTDPSLSRPVSKSPSKASRAQSRMSEVMTANGAANPIDRPNTPAKSDARPITPKPSRSRAPTVSKSPTPSARPTPYAANVALPSSPPSGSVAASPRTNTFAYMPMVFPDLTGGSQRSAASVRDGEPARAKSPALHPISNASRAPQSINGSAYGDRSKSRQGQSVRSGASQAGPTPLHPLTGIPSRHAPSANGDHHNDGRSVASHTRSRLGHDHRAPSPSRTRDEEFNHTPTPSRSHSPHHHHHLRKRYSQKELIDMIKTPRTSFTISPSVLADEVTNSHFHDEDLCVLLHAADDEYLHDVVKKAVRKAVRSRLKKLGLKHEDEFLTMVKNKSMGHGQGSPTQQNSNVTPDWAKPLFEMISSAHNRLDHLDQKIPSAHDSATSDGSDDGTAKGHHHDHHDHHDHEPAGTMHDSYGGDVETEHHHGHTTMDGSLLHEHEEIDDDLVDAADHREFNHTPHSQNTSAVRRELNDFLDPDHEGGESYEEELYKLRIKAPSSDHSHHTWEITRDEPDATRLEAPLPEIPDGDYYEDPVDLKGQRSHASSVGPSFPQPDLAPSAAQHWPTIDWPTEKTAPPPWQRVHQRLLNWAIVWPMSELDNALSTTVAGNQVDEVALSIWLTQVYKRYVRARHTDNPPQRVDRAFIPPNMADAINNAVFNGRHGDASSMLRDMWTPFGMEGIPRLLIVLAKHRRDASHYVVHRFSLPDGTLTTYDTYPERSLPDGRPLGWWFAIRAAWPHAMYPHPDNLVQKMVRLHRPMQLLVDNSVAAAAIWRNLLMGSKAERSVDLVRLRELVSTEVKALKQRKDLGRLSIGVGKADWDNLGG